MPALGNIRMHDSVDPALDAGSYRILTHSDTRDSGRALGENDQRFEITGPRFALEPGDVLARRPATDAVGGFGEDVPYVVLSRRTLPWERQGLGSGSPAGTPWLALLILRQDECQIQDSKPIADVVGAARAARFGPARNVRAVTMKPPRTLQQILPRTNELPFLCHVREVNLADMALAMADDDGWFAVVVANRLPLGSAAPGTPYVACLVSLEERDDLLGTPATQSLIVLDAWRFTSTTSGGTFRRLIRDASRDAFGAGAPTATGHVFLGATDRAGAAGSAAYRGPLAARVQRGSRPATVPGPDGTPVAERSLAVARELGRLLAAADGRFLREVIAWRRRDGLETAERASAAAVAATLSDTASPLAARGIETAPRAGADRRDSLATVAAVGALMRVLGRRPRRADPWGVPAVARDQARRLAVEARQDAEARGAAVRTVGAALVRGPGDAEAPLDALRRERDRLIGEEAR